MAVAGSDGALDAVDWDALQNMMIDTPLGRLPGKVLELSQEGGRTVVFKTTPGRIIFNETLPRTLVFKNS